MTGQNESLPKQWKDIKNRKDFEAELLRNGIGVVFRENEEGRIYGATFIDHEQRMVFNGSKMGKAYSANTFNELFQRPVEYASTIPINPVISNNVEQEPEKTVDSGSLLSNVFEVHGTDYEAEAFARQKQAEAKRNNRKGRRR